MEKLNNNNNEEDIAAIAYHLQIVSCDPRVTSENKKQISELFSKFIINYPDGIPLYSSASGIRELYLESRNAIISLIENQDSLVRVRGAYTAYIIAEEKGVLDFEIIQALKSLNSKTLEEHWANNAFEELN